MPDVYLTDQFPPCEVCGESSANGTLDTIVSEETLVDGQGRKWSQSSGHGGFHWRCKIHPHYTRHMSRAELDQKLAQRPNSAVPGGLT